MTTLRKDLNLIADLVENNSKVIDIGQKKVNQCVVMVN